MEAIKTVINNIPGIINTVVFGFIIIIGIVGGVKHFRSKQEIEDVRKKTKKILVTLGQEKVLASLNEYELVIASQLVDSSQIDVTFEDIAGLDNVVDVIKSNVILPLLMHPILKTSSPYFQPPKGVLLHGPPGCGKTMIAKATAKEAKANFLNLEVPSLTNKWYGESQKLALAVFTLAQKLQPCIIFIDEIDTFLRSRSKEDHEATAMMKAQFMILWDGLHSRKDNDSVVVFGATNRPSDVDEAIRRRMPATFEIPLPKCDSRKAILEVLLKDEFLDSDVDLEELANSTADFSSSDLKEFCRNAVFARVREISTEIVKIVTKTRNIEVEKELLERIANLRPVNHSDFQAALELMKQNRCPSSQIKSSFSCNHAHTE